MDFSNLLSMAKSASQPGNRADAGHWPDGGHCAGRAAGHCVVLTQPGRLWAHRALNGVLGW